MFNSIAILIPAYNPAAPLVELVCALRDNEFRKIVIVDDGSANADIFDEIAARVSVTILRHSKNLGKGAALKTGFNYISEQYPHEAQTVITVDADGQHLSADVTRIALRASKAPQNMILGVRDFQGRVPLRSAFGNALTSLVLRKAKSINLSDTQTGLRAIPMSFAISCCDITSNRYEFELESIVLANESGISIQELPITTVYVDNNESSHFRPILDSMRIYAVFARFISISLASFLIDITIFAICYSLTSQVFNSTYLARAASASFNFFGNKIFVFQSREKSRAFIEMLGYLVLVILIASLSAYFVNLIHNSTELDILLVKILVDSALFICSFLAQQILLFRKR
jgi:glycosyltransferase involved in cell wall biosynthesis